MPFASTLAWSKSLHIIALALAGQRWAVLAVVEFASSTRESAFRPGASVPNESPVVLLDDTVPQRCCRTEPDGGRASRCLRAYMVDVARLIRTTRKARRRRAESLPRGTSSRRAGKVTDRVLSHR